MTLSECSIDAYRDNSTVQEISLAEQDHLSQVAYNVALHILNMLDVQSLISMSKTSRLWHNLAENRSLWKNLYEEEFGNKIEGMDYKVEYIKRYVLMENVLINFPDGRELLKNLEAKFSLEERKIQEEDEIFDTYVNTLFTKYNDPALSSREKNEYFYTHLLETFNRAVISRCMPLIRSFIKIPFFSWLTGF